MNAPEAVTPVTLWRGDHYEGDSFFLSESKHQRREEWKALPVDAYAELVAEREQGVEYSVAHHPTGLLVVSNHGGRQLDGALAKVRQMIGAEPRTRGFGNARFVRNLFETAVAHQAMRLAPLTDPSNEELATLTADDIAPVDA